MWRLLSILVTAIDVVVLTILTGEAILDHLPVHATLIVGAFLLCNTVMMFRVLHHEYMALERDRDHPTNSKSKN